MRHFLANIVTYAIALLLGLGAALFAWVRSNQFTLVDERFVLARFEPAPAHEFEWAELGRRGYLRNCATCHRPDGSGWDQYPPLGHVGAFVHVPEGREYLIDVHLHGLASERHGAPMPPMRHMTNVELAAVMNHVLTSFGNERVVSATHLVIPPDVAARRVPRLTPREVNERRPGSR